MVSRSRRPVHRSTTVEVLHDDTPVLLQELAAQDGSPDYGWSVFLHGGEGALYDACGINRPF